MIRKIKSVASNSYKRILSALGQHVFTKNIDFQSRIYKPSFNDRLIWINPSNIQYSTLHGRGLKEVQKNGHFIIGGDWDIENKIEKKFHLTIDEMFIQGVPYNKTTQYKRMRQAVEMYLNGETQKPQQFGAYWCRTLKDIDKYFEILSKTYEDIRRNGYKTQNELGGKIGDEIRGYVGRNGELILGGGGNHRFSICHHLKINRIPFLVLSVHRNWVEYWVSSNHLNVRKAINVGLKNLQESGIE